jgi:glycosyltransferase involved in cell wall biosynthesis
MGGYADLLAAWRLSRHVKATRPDVLHMHTANAHAVGVRAARFLGKGRPRTVVSRHVAYSIFRHSFFGLNRLKYTRGVDRILCVSDAVKDVLLRDGLPPERLAVVPAAVDAEPLRAAPDRAAGYRREFGIPEDALVVGTVGALTPEKGHGTLLDALEQVLPERPRVHALIVGDGPLRAALAARAAAPGLHGRVRLAGFRDDVPSLLRFFDVFAFASESEGFSLAVLEALLAGRCVVSTATGAVPGWIRDGVEGLLASPRDAASLADALARCLDDADLRRRLAAAGRARVEGEASPDRLVERTMAEYRRVLEPAA